jgi:hypothetical protein
MGTKRWRAAGLDIDDRNPLDTDSVTTG